MNREKQLRDLQERLGYTFKDETKLLQALTHASFAHEKTSQDNEKMEFLGDSLLDVFVREKIYCDFPHLRVGEMSRFKSFLVNEQSLFKLAKFLGLGTCLLFGRGERSRGDEEHPGALADAFEAVLAAVYLDSHFQQTKQVFLQIICDYEQSQGICWWDAVKMNSFDCKTRLQEQTMKFSMGLPQYKSVKKGNKFLVTLLIQGERFGEALAPNKHQAEERLAKRALKKFENLKK